MMLKRKTYAVWCEADLLAISWDNTYMIYLHVHAREHTCTGYTHLLNNLLNDLCTICITSFAKRSVKRYDNASRNQFDL